MTEMFTKVFKWKSGQLDASEVALLHTHQTKGSHLAICVLYVLCPIGHVSVVMQRTLGLIRLAKWATSVTGHLTPSDRRQPQIVRPDAAASPHCLWLLRFLTGSPPAHAAWSQCAPLAIERHIWSAICLQACHSHSVSATS